MSSPLGCRAGRVCFLGVSPPDPPNPPPPPPPPPSPTPPIEGTLGSLLGGLAGGGIPPPPPPPTPPPLEGEVLMLKGVETKVGRAEEGLLGGVFCEGVRGITREG